MTPEITSLLCVEQSEKPSYMKTVILTECIGENTIQIQFNATLLF